jgi:hypothetical protein
MKDPSIMANDQDTITTSEPDPRTLAEIWISMSEDGSYEVGTTEEEAAERLMESQGGHRCRSVMLSVLMLPPQVTEVSVTVPDEIGSTVTVEPAADDEIDHAVGRQQTD